MGRRLLDNLMVKLDDVLADDLQHRSSSVSEVIVSSPMRPRIRLYFAPQPSVAFHALQQRVQSTRADVVAVTPKFAENPLTYDRMFGSMVKDVHLPETQQDLAREQLSIVDHHRLGRLYFGDIAGRTCGSPTRMNSTFSAS